MLTLKDYMECISYRITEGSEYMWDCYGPDAYNIDSGSNYGENTISIVFDKKTQEVYQMEAWDFAKKRSYRWINPAYVDAIKDESKKRNIDFEQSVDDEKFINIDVVADMLEKATAIANNVEYDTRIQVELNLADAEMLCLMTMAHERDLTLNQMVEHILTELINKEKSNEQ
jgi:hypothetical protein